MNIQKSICAILSFCGVFLVFLCSTFVASASAQQTKTIILPERIDWKSELIVNPGKGWVIYGYDDSMEPFIDQTEDTWNAAGLGYLRFNWSTLEPYEGDYQWQYIDKAIADCKAHGKKLAFGVMSCNGFASSMYVTPKYVFDAGAASYYLQSIDIASHFQYVPVWNDPIYLQKLEKFMRALAERYDNNSDIAYMDIRSYGNYGGNDIWGFTDPNNLIRMETITALEYQNLHLQMYRNLFKKLQLVTVNSDTDNLNSVFYWGIDQGIAGRTDSAITNRNSAGELWKYRNKLPTILEFGYSYPKMRDTGVWKDDYLYQDIASSCATYVSMGKYGDSAEFYREKHNVLVETGNRMGYYFVLEKAIYDSLGMDSSANLMLQWRNKGVAPIFIPAHVAVALLDATTGDVVEKKWLEKSNPQQWLPGQSITENLSFAFTTHIGTYKLAIGLFTDENLENPDIKLGIKGRNSKGWYVLSDMPTCEPNFIRRKGDQLVIGPKDTPIKLQGVAFGNEVWSNSIMPPTAHHNELDYQRVKDMNMTVIRFYLNYQLFEDDSQPYQYRQSGWDWLDRNIVWAKKYGIYLILNMHVPQGGYQSNLGGAALWNDQQNQTRLAALWKAIAQRYRDEPMIAGYDILNEPIPTGPIWQWENLANQIVYAIRSVDSNHLVIVERANGINNYWSSDSNFFLVDDDNVMYTFHFYDPIQYTLQNTSWTGMGDGGKYPDDTMIISYPSDLIWADATFNNPTVPAGITGWTYYPGNLYQVTDPGIFSGKPAFMPANLPGTVYFDGVVIEEYDENMNYIGKVVEMPSMAANDWNLWSADGSGYFAGSYNNLDPLHPSSLFVGQTTGDANLYSDRFRFPVTYGHYYKISGWAQGNDVGPNSVCRFRIDFEKSASGQMPIRRNKMFLETGLQKFLSFGLVNNVPLFVGEFGVYRDCFTQNKGGLQWVGDVLDLLKKYGVNFTYHAYHEYNMGIYSNDGLPEEASGNQPLISLLRTKLDPAKEERTITSSSADWAGILLDNGCVVSNNVWNKAAAVGDFGQQIFLKEVAGEKLFGWQWIWPSSGSTLAYPEVIYGDKPWDAQTGRIAALPFLAGTKNITVNFDIDLFTTGISKMNFTLMVVSGLPATEANITDQITIWNYNHGFTPGGTKTASITVDGVDYDVYINYRSSSSGQNWNYIAFVARQSFLQGTLEIGPFINYLLEQGVISQNLYITSIELGNEVIQGSGMVEIRNYQVIVQ
jgi:endoglucanase